MVNPPPPPQDTGGVYPPVIVQPRAHSALSLGGDVLEAFKTSPVLLLIVLLNIAFAGVGGYYLLQVEAYRARNNEMLAKLLTECLTHTVPIEYLKQQRSP